MKSKKGNSLDQKGKGRQGMLTGAPIEGEKPVEVALPSVPMTSAVIPVKPVIPKPAEPKPVIVPEKPKVWLKPVNKGRCPKRQT